MADVKTLNANNNSYNIKDETARTDIAKIKAGRNFSTNEIDTGMTWIDGKPIYRKVYKGTVSQTAQVLISASNVDSLVNYDGWYRVAGNTHYKPWYAASGGATWFVTTIDSNLLRVRFDSNTPIADINDVCCIVDYTKTTD